MLKVILYEATRFRGLGPSQVCQIPDTEGIIFIVERISPFVIFLPGKKKKNDHTDEVAPETENPLV